MTPGIVAWLWGAFFVLAAIIAIVVLIIAGKSVK